MTISKRGKKTFYYFLLIFFSTLKNQISYFLTFEMIFGSFLRKWGGKEKRKRDGKEEKQKERDTQNAKTAKEIAKRTNLSQI